MQWITMEGEIKEFHEIETSHLFFSVRMIFNGIVPEKLRIPNTRYYPTIKRQDPKSLREAVIQMMAEITQRDDLQTWMLRQLNYMEQTCRQLLNPQIPK